MALRLCIAKSRKKPEVHWNRSTAQHPEDGCLSPSLIVLRVVLSHHYFRFCCSFLAREQSSSLSLHFAKLHHCRLGVTPTGFKHCSSGGVE
ncbi:hypothetical protein Y1Q_0001245 [Alligator mississippiensis]|uniref:Uncharacterized protein n=1 Tax=Alligator mississippiensis TaxID=8496 RepID=A0A151PEF3_ALLMI|nr:hypothetical protein Y1Q_0001245 [Alligator mississippiensis]